MTNRSGVLVLGLGVLELLDAKKVNELIRYHFVMVGEKVMSRFCSPSAREMFV